VFTLLHNLIFKNQQTMKTKLLIIIGILFPLFAFSQTKPEDFKWEGGRSYLNNFEVSYLKDQYNTMYYLMDNYIMITSNMKGVKPKKVEFENGDIRKISESVYCIKPKKLGRSLLTIDEDSHSYLVKELPKEKINIKFSASTSPFNDCVSIDELYNSNEMIAIFNNQKIKIKSFDIGFSSKTPDYYLLCTSYDTLSGELKKLLKENIRINSTVKIDFIKIYYYDTLMALPHVEIKVVDNYQNEFIRRTLKLSPITNEMDLMKNDLRIKITGNPQKEDIKTIQDLANELNGILETIKVKIVDKQPSLTIEFDTSSYRTYLPKNSSESEKKDFDNKQMINYFKTDSLFIAKGYKRIYDGYLLEKTNLFFSFNKKYWMYYNHWGKGERSNYEQKMIRIILRRNIIGLLANIYDNKFDYSFSSRYSFDTDLTSNEKYLLKTLYSDGGEEKVKKLLNEGNIREDKTPLYIIMLVLCMSLLFVFSEIYHYYGLSNRIGKIKVKILK